MSVRRVGMRLAGALVLAAGAALACQVPVFRYALERWDPDPYVVYVRAPQGDAEREALAALRADFATGDNRLLAVRELSESEARSGVEVSEAVRGRLTDSSVGMVLTYPAASARPGAVVTHFPLSADAVAQLLDSPKRREIRDRLLAGDSAVWILLESGNKAADNAAETTLQAGFNKIYKEIKLPEGVLSPDAAREAERAGKTVEPDNLLRADVPLKLAFSVVRMSRQDPAEAALLACLFQSEADLALLAEEPLVFPVFGRGRALNAYVGAGITVENVFEGGAYLAGACSCQVKAENPGFDLLLSVDWDEALGDVTVIEDKALPPLIGVGDLRREPVDRSEDGETKARTDKAPEAGGTQSVLNSAGGTQPVLNSAGGTPTLLGDETPNAAEAADGTPMLLIVAAAAAAAVFILIAGSVFMLRSRS